MKKRIFTIFLILFLTIGIGISTIIILLNREGLTLESIEETYNKGDYQEATEKIEEYVSKHDDSTDAWQLYGKIYLEQTIYDKAAAGFKQAIELDPENYQAFSAIGTLMRKTNELEASEVYYAKAIKLNESYAPAYTGLALVYLDQEKYTDAILPAEKAHELDRENPTYAANLSVVYHFNEMETERDEMYELAKNLDYEYLNNLSVLFASKSYSYNYDLDDYSFIEAEKDRVQENMEEVVIQADENKATVKDL